MIDFDWWVWYAVGMVILKAVVMVVENLMGFDGDVRVGDDRSVRG